ncbi:diaminopimelate epimerase [Tenacibaculum finnmarkense]|uniref:diaminopimelate epimerase n=1 Tax=Tenacibaculum finnmarkense TaxID=2781243 RepID=UPI00187B8754|nr:diaminopimelate epimerase [Tenacibaculum finnmarkense]MBE7660534.1 diaminopimelate epimerase [Tenacibaculum finnmarkense genomovar finnmarkense]MCG8252223.1 diaminopimelate epimerase [Tenacibaculum finnmarkense genomovar finnmarkense]MCG8815702.1 diaminopimelate epimerase [Tenacibaculum finnmarkense]MCG8821459.1 diaminopimelate epimerase [Tenacibaculum finnmarkense]
MNLQFYKYQGTGNDFVIIDNRNENFPKNDAKLISKLCHRHFGVGADGVILLENDAVTDFKMFYFNADASQTMCGNGGRCAVAFAKELGIIDTETTFTAFDGEHYAQINNDIVSLQMINVNEIIIKQHAVFANTGTQHHVELVDNLDNYPVFENGKKIRYNDYGTQGTNVNFVQQINKNTFRVRTYEKGVEDETLACGTGVTAVAIAMHATKKTTDNIISLPVQGGLLEVRFNEKDGNYTDIFLKGKAELVFKGVIKF